MSTVATATFATVALVVWLVCMRWSLQAAARIGRVTADAERDDEGGK